jgi:hypothetical protein
MKIHNDLDKLNLVLQKNLSNQNKEDDDELQFQKNYSNDLQELNIEDLNVNNQDNKVNSQSNEESLVVKESNNELFYECKNTDNKEHPKLINNTNDDGVQSIMNIGQQMSDLTESITNDHNESVFKSFNNEMKESFKSE